MKILKFLFVLFILTNISIADEYDSFSRKIIQKKLLLKDEIAKNQKEIEDLENDVKLITKAKIVRTQYGGLYEKKNGEYILYIDGRTSVSLLKKELLIEKNNLIQNKKYNISKNKENIEIFISNIISGKTPKLSVDKLAIGDYGVLPEQNMKTIQVISSKNSIIEHSQSFMRVKANSAGQLVRYMEFLETSFWLENYDTDDLLDDRGFTLSGFFIVPGTKTYQTVNGQKTIMKLVYLPENELEKFKEVLRKILSEELGDN
jgi:hypothetical protein